MNAREGEYTSSVERLRAEYLEMRASGFGFTDLYAAEWDRILAAHDEAIRAEVREAVAVGIQLARQTPPDDVSGAISAYPQNSWRVLSAMWHLGMDSAATIARGEI